MRRARGWSRGYTVIEVMIFLVVTSLLFTMIALTFSGVRGRTQFETAARDIESRVRDIINDTASGYYYRTSNFDCAASATGPVITPGGSEQGSNQDCVFIGRVLHFNVDSDATSYHVYNAAGLREVFSGANAGQEASNFEEAKPTLVFGGAAAAERLTLPNAMEAASAYYVSDGSEQLVSAIGFFSSFGRFDGGAGGAGGALQPGALSINVVPLGSNFGSTEGDVFSLVQDLGSAPNPSVENPDGGIVVCINSGTSDQHAVLKIGGGGQQLTTDLTIGSGLISEGGTCG